MPSSRRPGSLRQQLDQEREQALRAALPGSLFDRLVILPEGHPQRFQPQQAEGCACGNPDEDGLHDA